MPKQTTTRNEARSSSDNAPIKVITVNRQAYHDYFVERTIEAGIALSGTEIKSIREGKVNLRGAYAIARNGETKGLTLIPLKLYLKGGKAKIELGLCRGKKLYDKREAIAERDVKREMERVIRKG